MKVVLDTNVLVSALINPAGVPATILNLVLNGRVTLLYDNRIMAEYRAVLQRGKFSFSPELIEPLLEFMVSEGDFVAAEPLAIPFADAGDKKFLEVAQSGRADCLITGNLRHFPAREDIMTPKRFLESILSQR